MPIMELMLLGMVAYAIYTAAHMHKEGQLRALAEMLLMLYHMIRQMIEFREDWSYVDFFEKQVDLTPDNVLFVTVEDDRHVTLEAMDRQANQVAHWARDVLELPQKTCVALMMLNRPELVTFWLGMAKVGVSTSLVNSTIAGKPFVHSITLSLKDSEKKVAVIDSELKDSLSSEISDLKKQGIQIYLWGELEAKLSAFPSDRPSQHSRNEVKASDPLIWIFTSGTTGLPKASKISSVKYLKASVPALVYLQTTSKDRMYNCLPLYHSAGGVMAMSTCIRAGATMVLRRKFSARSFTADCLKYRCTTMQYIGELCRYLVNAPPNADDDRVRLKAVIGNGMRPDVWEKFQSRYDIQRVIEVYASTEGNCAFANSTGKVGALGWLPSLLKPFMPVYILRVDPNDKSVPLRDSNGFCIEAEAGEVGLLCALINTESAVLKFDGYSDKKATEKKILHDVFRTGDAYFNSGDLLWTQRGYYYWSDRVGDTFRWKGENVSTSEVENALSDCSFIDDLSVYGVEIPNCDGRVGMAAIILKEGISAGDITWNAFMEVCQKNLAAYSRPAFIRVQTSLAVTATFKHQKTKLVEEGFDPKNSGIVKSNDHLFHYSQKKKEVIRLDDEIYAQIISGHVQV